MKTIMTMLALILALGAGLALADEMPVPAQRIWAPAGDEVGTENHLTATGVLNDNHGDEARAAEDEGIMGDTMGLALWGWFMRGDGYKVSGRGLASNLEGDDLVADLLCKSTVTGKHRESFRIHTHDLYYDRDSELRNPGFPFAEPAQLGVAPQLSWRRGLFNMNYHASSILDLRLSVDDLRREGAKSSLTAQTPPGVQGLETQMSEVAVGGAVKLGQLGADLELSYLRTEDDRSYQTGHMLRDKRDRYSAVLDAAYDLNPTTRLLAGGHMSRLEHTGREVGTGNAGATDGDTDSAAYQVALLKSMGKTNVRVSARFDTHDTEAANTGDTGVIYGADRERDRQRYELVLDNRSLARTQVQLRYRYTSGSETETITEGMLPNAPGATLLPVDSDLTRQDLGLRVRTRLSRTMKLRAELRHSSMDVEQSADAGLWYDLMGDYERSRLCYQVALQTRMARKLPLDLGVRGSTQTFKRTEGDEVETTADMMGLFVNANWMASSRLTVFGMITYGTETYELDATEPTPGYAAYNVDATTLRLSPGATFSVSPKLMLDAWYEGVVYEDNGDESDGLDAIEANRDRLSFRARYQASEKLAMSMGYARYELDENLWDDHIEHLWTLSAHTKF